MKVRMTCIFAWAAATLLLGCTHKTSDLVEASLSGDLPRVQALLKDGANIEGTAFDGLTPLDAAAKKGHLEILKYLISQGAAVNGAQGTERTALGLAAIYEHTECVQYLISQGGEIRGTTAWKQGLLDSLRTHNKSDLYEIVKQQIDKQSPSTFVSPDSTIRSRQG
jgi:ankyrin repeat protein